MAAEAETAVDAVAGCEWARSLGRCDLPALSADNDFVWAVDGGKAAAVKELTLAVVLDLAQINADLSASGAHSQRLSH